MNKNAIIYARVSSVKQKEGETVQSQVSALIDYASKQGYTIPNGWIFKDEGFSGSRLQRPALDALRELVQENLADIVLVYSPDRLSRKYAYQLLLEIEFQKRGVELIFFNTPKAKNPEEQLSLHFKSIFAEYERAQIIERCRRGRNHRAAQGSVSVIATAPFGYNYIKKSETSIPHYTVNENAEIVRKIFLYYTDKRFSISKICRELQLEGILSPSGGKKWYTSTVRDILKNEAYIGTAHFGKSEPYEGVPGRIYRTSNGERRNVPIAARRQRPKELWIPIKIPQIISESDFEIAQNKLEENKKLSLRNTKKPSILQGLLVCGYCGSTYYKKIRNSKNSYYSCGRRLNTGSCKAPSLKQQELDDNVWEHIINLLKDPSLIAKEIERRLEENSDLTRTEESIKNLDKELLRLTKSRDKLLDAYQEGDSISLDELKTRLLRIEQRNKAILKEKKSLEDLKSSERKIRNMKMHIDDLKLQIENAKKTSLEEKQAVLRLLVNEIVITNEQVEIKHCIPCQDKDLCNVSPLRSDGSL
jgi:site-specific DNA recombinase